MGICGVLEGSWGVNGRTWKIEVREIETVNVGALIIRVGFGGMLYYNVEQRGANAIFTGVYSSQYQKKPN